MTCRAPSRVQLFDVDQFGEPRTGAVYLVRGDQTALVDTGTARSAPLLAAALCGVRIDWILVTHAHLDHAGGAGALAAGHPEATVVAHPRAVPHLAAPARLEEGVRAASPELFPLYGRPVPLPPSRVRECADGEALDLGQGLTLQAVYAPGHAPHHVCWFERRNAILFAGDAVGHYDVPVDLPLTVPPRFDLEKGRATLAALCSLRPRTLAFAHFGFADRAVTRLVEYGRAVEEWLRRVAALRRRMTDSEVVDHILGEQPVNALSSVGREVARLCIAGALASLSEEVP